LLCCKDERGQRHQAGERKCRRTDLCDVLEGVFLHLLRGHGGCVDVWRRRKRRGRELLGARALCGGCALSHAPVVLRHNTSRNSRCTRHPSSGFGPEAEDPRHRRPSPTFASATLPSCCFPARAVLGSEHVCCRGSCSCRRNSGEHRKSGRRRPRRATSAAKRTVASLARPPPRAPAGQPLQRRRRRIRMRTKTPRARMHGWTMSPRRRHSMARRLPPS
jgi:hypothetical protein